RGGPVDGNRMAVENVGGSHLGFQRVRSLKASAMSISFKCPQCNHGYKVDDAAAGKRAKCAKCGATMTVPEPEPAAPSLLSELFDSEEGETSSQGSQKLELGYSIQPSAELDDDEDEFELEPPITPPVVMPFLDDDPGSTSGPKE